MKTKTKTYLYDEGVLLDKNDKDYEHYNIVYDKQHGYYDHCQTMFQPKELQEWIDEAKSYIERTTQNTYVVITEQDFFSNEVDGCYYGKDAIVYSICKNNKGEVIENFIK